MKWGVFLLTATKQNTTKHNSIIKREKKKQKQK